MIITLSNHYLAELHKGNIDYTSDVFKIALMQNTFVFNRDSNATWPDCSSGEITDGNGYTSGGGTLANVDLSAIEDDTNDNSVISWDDYTWTASGGSIAARGAIIYDDTTADKTVVCYADFESEQQVDDGSPLTAKNIFVSLRQRV